MPASSLTISEQRRRPPPKPPSKRIQTAREPLPSIEELSARWEAEWAAVDGWLETLDDAFVGYVFDGVPVWQMLVHVVNHGTQHRSEAAAILTAEGRPPGELDLIDYAEGQAGRDGAG